MPNWNCPAISKLLRQAAPRFLAIGLFLVLTGSTAAALPYRMGLYRNYNDVGGSLEQAVAAQRISAGLVVLGEPVYLNWVRAARLLPVNVRAGLVFASRGPDEAKLLRAYEGWPIYLYDDTGLRPYVEAAP